MEEKPLLQFYVDETWGYDAWDEADKKQEGVKVKFQQEEGETREDFFKRLGFEPKFKMYGSNLEKDRKCNDEDSWVRYNAAYQGYGLDVLVHDKDPLVRKEVALNGYGLDILINDKEWSVRTEVAEQGFGLDILVHDENEWVRAAVAWQGYGLDILIHDKNHSVRWEVARQGYGLDVLVHDENCYVREVVAWQGFGLDILVHDEDTSVRGWAKYCLEEKGYPSIEAWIEANPDKCADRKNL